MIPGVEYALTERQPWATLTVEGPRRYVNLTRMPWVALIGQRVAIHAAAKPDLDGAPQAMELLDACGVSEAKRARWKTRTVRGAIIGTAVFAGVVIESEDPWFVGPFGIWLTSPAVLAEPVVAEGKSGGFWRIGE